MKQIDWNRARKYSGPAALLLAFVLVATGVGGKAVKGCLAPVNRFNRDYLEDSTAGALELMVPVGLAKGAADIVEGTTLTFEAGVGVAAGSRVELGDALQPMLECLDLAWNVLILSIVFSTVTKYVLGGGDAVAQILLGVALGGFLLTALLRVWLRNTHALVLCLGRVARMCLLIALVFMLILPLTVYLSGHLSNATVAPLEDELFTSFRHAGEAFSLRGFPESGGVGEKARFLYDKSVHLMKYALESAAEIAGSVAKLIVSKVLSGVVFPLGILGFLVWLVRGAFYPIMGLSQGGLAGSDLLKLAELVNPRKQEEKRE